MELNHLQIFVAIVEEKTMSAAAKRMHLTQPALSHNLKMLEEQLQVQLFQRQGRGLQLTPTGRSFLQQAQKLLSQAQEMIVAARRNAVQDYFDLRIGSVDSAATHLLPNVFPMLQRSFPQLVVKLQTGRTPELLNGLSENELDLALVAHSGPPPNFISTPVGAYRLHYYGLKTKFSGLVKAKKFTDVLQFPLVELQPNREQKFHPPATNESYGVVASLDAVKALVFSGLGVGALLDTMLTKPELQQLAKANITHDPTCLWHVVRSPHWASAAELKIEQLLVKTLRQVLK